MICGAPPKADRLSVEQGAPWVALEPAAKIPIFPNVEGADKQKPLAILGGEGKVRDPMSGEHVVDGCPFVDLLGRQMTTSIDCLHWFCNNGPI